jgi:hypothetical protein
MLRRVPLSRSTTKKPRTVRTLRGFSLGYLLSI